MSYYRKLYSCEELPSRAKLVYIYLYDRCDKEKKAWPSIKTIAKQLSISDKTVRRAIKDLERQGLSARSIRNGRMVHLRAIGIISPKISPKFTKGQLCPFGVSRMVS